MFAFWVLFRLAIGFASQSILLCRVNLMVYMSGYPCLMFFEGVRESLPVCLEYGEGDVVCLQELFEKFREGLLNLLES